MPQIKDLLSILRGETSIVPTGGAVSAPHPLQDAAANEAPPAPADWSAIYMDYLKMEGYAPSLDGNGDIRFKHDNWHLCLMRDKRDAEHFRAVLPNFWSLESDKERARAERAADRVNRKIKVAKVHSGAGTDMWVSVEMFVADHRQVRPVLMRCVRLLPEAAMLFRAMMTALDD